MNRESTYSKEAYDLYLKITSELFSKTKKEIINE